MSNEHTFQFKRQFDILSKGTDEYSTTVPFIAAYTESELSQNNHFVDVGAGVVDYLGVLQALKVSGYEGYLSIEYEETPDVERGTADSLSRLRVYMASLDDG